MIVKIAGSPIFNKGKTKTDSHTVEISFVFPERFFHKISRLLESEGALNQVGEMFYDLKL